MSIEDVQFQVGGLDLLVERPGEETILVNSPSLGELIFCKRVRGDVVVGHRPGRRRETNEPEPPLLNRTAPDRTLAIHSGVGSKPYRSLS